jgi:hypothetical protein
MDGRLRKGVNEWEDAEGTKLPKYHNRITKINILIFIG